jgi:CubicO group peptidase (beta-lactamase class C family)
LDRGAPGAIGFCATARDVARLGQLIVDNGRRGDRQIIAESSISDIENDGDADAWRNGEWGRSFPRTAPTFEPRIGATSRRRSARQRMESSEQDGDNVRRPHTAPIASS